MSFESKESVEYREGEEWWNDDRVSQYLERALPESEQRIHEAMRPECDVAVVIPSCGERQYFLRPILSLLEQEGVAMDKMEVIVVVNNSEEPRPRKTKKHPPETEEQYAAYLAEWPRYKSENQEVLKIARLIKGERVDVAVSESERGSIQKIQDAGLTLHVIDKASEGKMLPQEKANVGGARNRGVAEAIERFASIHKNGLIVQTDNEAAFRPDFVSAAMRLMREHPELVGVSGYVEHVYLEEDMNEDARRLFFFARMERIYKRLSRQRSFPDVQEEKRRRFVGSNMVHRAYESALAGGVPEDDEKEDTAFKERLEGIGKTDRAPELIVDLVDRVSLRTGGIHKSMGWQRRNQQSEIEHGGTITVDRGVPIEQAAEELIELFCRDVSIRAEYESALSGAAVEEVPNGIDPKFGEVMRKLQALYSVVGQ